MKMDNLIITHFVAIFIFITNLIALFIQNGTLMKKIRNCRVVRAERRKSVPRKQGSASTVVETYSRGGIASQLHPRERHHRGLRDLEPRETLNI